jgi:hypothetical protein
MVRGFIARLKVALTDMAGQTPIAPAMGASEITAGGAQGLLPVVKVHTKLLASAMPYTSVAPVVIVAVYIVLSARTLEGVKVAVVPAAAYVTVPATGVVPGPVNVKVVPLIVAGFIATLKVAVTSVLGHTPLAGLRGVAETTIGALTVGFRLVLS